MAKMQKIVFLIDDDPMQTQMLHDYLDDKFELVLHTYSTGEEALENLHLNPELIILDYHLMSVNKSAEDGVAILKALKEKRPEIQVVMLSGQDKIQIAVECMKHGAYDYVVKSESAFMRIENIMNNIGEHMRTTHLLKMYKRGLTIALIAIGVIIIGAVIAVKMGIATANFVVF